MLNKLTTESRNPASETLDQLSAIEIVQLMNAEDAQVSVAVGKEAEVIARAVEIIADRLRDGGRLIYIGAGTSGRLGVLDASECPPTFNSPPELVVGLIAGGPAALTRSIEGAEDHPEDAVTDLTEVSLSQSDVLVGIATSGRTPYVIGGLQYARQLGAATIGFCCNDESALADFCDVIIEGDGFVKRQIDRVREDKNVKAIVLRINSPGGTVTGSDYIYHHLSRLRKERKLPMVVSMGSMAASGGYYAAMAVADQPKSIYAEPTTTTGSIGVIIPHYDISGLLSRYDVKDDSIASHPRKQMLSMTRPIPDDHRRILQQYVDDSFDRFKDIVKSGRPAFRENPELLDELATGEIFSAMQAKENGLVDEIGFIEDAIDRALEMAGLDKETTRVVRYQKHVGLLDLPALAVSRSERSSDLSKLLELSTPRAYYLATSLPPFAASYAQLLESN